jgi:hypothetical protein
MRKALVASRKTFATPPPIPSEAAPKATPANADTVPTVTTPTPKHPAPTTREKAERGLHHGAHPPRRNTVKAQTGLWLSQASALSTNTTIFLPASRQPTQPTAPPYPFHTRSSKTSTIGFGH